MPVVAPEAFGVEDLGESFRRAHRELKELLADPTIKSLTVLVGVPGAGKSTYAKAIDTAATVVFDSVAARPGARAALIKVAGEAGKPVDAVFLDTDFGLALARNDLRPVARRVNLEKMHVARDFLKEKPPTIDEGFRHVSVVRKDTIMPLNKSCSVEAFRSNISTERAAGKPLDQAVAIARSTLEASCAAAGRPVPGAVSKEADALEAVAKDGHAAPRQPPETDLDQALNRARSQLNPRDFALVHHAAKASPLEPGRLTPLERIVVEKISVGSLSNDELRDAFQKFKRRFAAGKRKHEDIEPVIQAARPYLREMRKRGIRSGGDLMVAISKEASLSPAGQVFTGSREKVAKGFVNGQPEGGMHAHGLDRLAGATFTDGAHLHLFVMPGTREVMITFEDGQHTHELLDGAATNIGSAHVHSLMLLDGQMLLTTVGGLHEHALMVETSAFNGEHTHRLRLPDGQEIESLTVEQFVAEFLDDDVRGHPMPPASFITDALNEVSLLQEETFELRMDLRQAERIAAEGAEVPLEFRSSAEVVQVLPDEIVMQIGNGDPFGADRGVLKEADVQLGDMVELFNTHDGSTIVGFSKEAVPTSRESIVEWAEWYDVAKMLNAAVPFTGPDDAPVLFIASSPSMLEAVRQEALVGPDAETFANHYLEPLGLTRDQVAIGFVVPVEKESPENSDAEVWRPHLIRGMQRFTKARIVALGRFAKEALQGVEHHYMPHPAAVRKHTDTSQVDRKARALRKALDESPRPVKNRSRPNREPGHGNQRTNLAETKSELAKAGKVLVTVAKLLEEQRIVEGVVIDPYEVDFQGEWTPPSDVERTAYGFTEHSRLIGFRHALEIEGATLVSSFVEPYPSDEDRERAHQNLPHKVYRRPFGNDVIKSGSWAAAVRLPEAVWQEVKAGNLNAFSIGGGSFKIQLPVTAMPEVEFIDLVPQPAP